MELRMYLFTVENELHSAFPNTKITLCIYLCFMVSNCTGERSYLSCVELRMSSKCSWTRKTKHAVSNEHEIRGDTDLGNLETIINDFACKKCGVMKLFVAAFFPKSTHD